MKRLIIENEVHNVGVDNRKNYMICHIMQVLDLYSEEYFGEELQQFADIQSYLENWGESLK